jgi:hypothetical protein
MPSDRIIACGAREAAWRRAKSFVVKWRVPVIVLAGALGVLALWYGLRVAFIWYLDSHQPTLAEAPMRTDWEQLARELPRLHSCRACYWKQISFGGFGPTVVHTEGYVLLCEEDVQTLRRDYSWARVPDMGIYAESNRMPVPPELAHLSFEWCHTDDESEWTLSRPGHSGLTLLDQTHAVLYFRRS